MNLGSGCQFWGGGGGVKSINSGTIAITAGNTVATATITAVSTSDTITGFGGYDSSDGTNPLARLEQTNATTYTATRVGTTNISTVSYAATEYQPGMLKSLQRGTISVGAGTSSATATISSVTTAKAFPLYLGNSVTDAAGTGSGNRWWSRLVLTNATTVTASRDAGFNTYAIVVSYEVPEYL